MIITMFVAMGNWRQAKCPAMWKQRNKRVMLYTATHTPINIQDGKVRRWGFFYMTFM